MSNNVSDYDLIKEKLSEDELLTIGAASAVLGLVCTAVLCAMGYLVQMVITNPTISEHTRIAILITIIVAATVSFYKGAEYYYESINSFRDLFYNKNREDNFEKQANGVVKALVSSLIVGTTAMLYYYDPSITGGVLVISAVFSAFFFFIYRKQELTVGKAVTYIEYGLVTGIAAYGLGVLITISIGLIGLLFTSIILALEIIFTSMFIYISLCEWLEREREKIKTAEREAIKAAFATAQAAEELGSE
jgi:hypothetical protein